MLTLVAGGGSHHAEVAEHRVGLPATDEFDGFGVDSSAEEGGSTAWAETAAGDGIGGNASLLLDRGCTDAEAGGESGGRKGAFLQGVIVVVVEAIGMRNAVPLEVKYAACDGAARAKEWVVGGAVCDTLAFHRILLVSKRECDLRHTINVCVIQRCDDGSVDAAAHGDSDVADAEGLGASLGVVA